MRQIFAAAVMAAAVTAAPAAAQPVNFASGQQGSQNFSINSAIAAALTKEGLDVRVQSYGGSGVFLPLVHAGEIDFVAVPVPEFYDAYNGSPAFRGLKLDNLRVVSVLNPLPVGIFVRKDSAIASLADLRGKRLTYGISQQPSLISNIDGILATAGLQPSDVQRVLVPTVSQGVDEFLAGRTDAAFFALSGGKLVEADASSGGVRFLSVPNTAEALAAMRRVLPVAYIRRIEPGQGRVGIPQTTYTMAYDYVLAAGRHVPDEVAGRVARILHQNAPAIAAGARVLSDLEQGRMASRMEGLPHHRGAEAFYRQAGLMN